MCIENNEFSLNMMDSVLKTINFVLKTMNI